MTKDRILIVDDEPNMVQIIEYNLRKAGYGPEGVITLLEKLKMIKKEAPLQPLLPAYARSHPYITERIAAAKKEIYGKIDFSDYINK